MKLDVVTTAPRVKSPLYAFTRAAAWINAPRAELIAKWTREAGAAYDAAKPRTQRRGKEKVVVGFDDLKMLKRAGWVSSWVQRAGR
jgi:hypothetical protein